MPNTNKEETTVLARQILEGQIPPPDGYTTHVVRRCQLVRTEGEQLLKEIRQLEEVLAQKMARLSGIRDIVQNYLVDTSEWLGRDNGNSDPKAPNDIS